MCTFGILSKFRCHDNSLCSVENSDTILQFSDPINNTIHSKNFLISCTKLKSVQFWLTFAWIWLPWQLPFDPLKNPIVYLNSTTLKTLLFTQKSQYFIQNWNLCTFGLFLPKFGYRGNTLGSLEILDSVFEFTYPENPMIHAKIVSISCTQIKLFLFQCFIIFTIVCIGNFIDFYEK